MFFIILIILTTAFFTLYKKQNKFPEGYLIGDRQFSLIKTYQKSESTLLFIDQSAKYSLQQSIYELAQNGGIFGIYESEEIDTSSVIQGNEIVVQTNNKCGKFRGANIWYNLEID